MKITEVNVTPIKPINGLVAFASVVLEGCLYLGSIGVYTRLDGNGYRITYPTKKLANTDLHIYHPITKELSVAIETAIVVKAKQLFG